MSNHFEWVQVRGLDADFERAISTGKEKAMTDSIMMAGIRKVQYVRVYQKGVDGSPTIFENVESWRVGYNGILVIKGKNYTEIMSPDMWNRILVNDE